MIDGREEEGMPILVRLLFTRTSGDYVNPPSATHLQHKHTRPRVAQEPDVFAVHFSSLSVHRCLCELLELVNAYLFYSFNLFSSASSGCFAFARESSLWNEQVLGFKVAPGNFTLEQLE